MKIFKLVMKEWELAIFVVVLCLFFGVLVSWSLMTEDETVAKIGMPLSEENSEVLDPGKAFSYLRNSKTLKISETGDPFILQLPRPEDGVTDNNEIEEPDKSDPAPSPSEPEEADKPDDEEEEEEEPEPPPTAEIRFDGVIIDSKGIKWALIKDLENGSVEYRKTGESTRSLEIVEISRRQLKVTLPSGELAGIDQGDTLTYELK